MISNVTNIIIAVCNVALAFCAVPGVLNYFAIEKRKKIETAVSLAKYYKDSVLDNITAICDLYKRLNIDKIVDNLDSNKMKNFDEEEQKELLKGHLEDFEKMHEREDYIPNVLTISDIYHLNLYGVEYEKDKEKNKKVASVEPIILKSSIIDIKSNVLNSLEYFAMNFIYGVADEKNVYQSLSQTYIEVVKYLYYDISQLNHRANPKNYYTNVIELFKIWSKRLDESIENSKNINLKIKSNKL